jgi:hypothetical protein
VLVLAVTLAAPLAASSAPAAGTDPAQQSAHIVDPSSPLVEQAMRSDVLTVHVRVAYDQSITSKLLRRSFRNEAAAIWEDYGVEILWSDSEVPADVHLDAIVARKRSDRVLTVREPVLALTRLENGAVREPIRVLFDTIDAMLQERHEGIESARYEQVLGRALGRVLAHEIGHVLLGRQHDPEGLMRATFPVYDLTRFDRERFRLTRASADRLRIAIDNLAGAGGAF